tara:strand:+ start:1051 stop:3651 length:2601 start_codon:yes stop_codon:yes gene_type:complete
MSSTPFDIHQYEQHFQVESNHDIDIFENLGIDVLIDFLRERIRARQEAVVRGYMDINRYDTDSETIVNLHDNVISHPFGDISEFSDTGQISSATPGAITASCILMAEMIKEFVEGPIFERYALINCEEYGSVSPVIGFFHKSIGDGTMEDEFYTGIHQVHPHGVFSSPPVISDYNKLTDFGVAIGGWLNEEVIPCLNNLQFIHRALFYQYPALSCPSGLNSCTFNYYTNMHSNTVKPVDIIIDADGLFTNTDADGNDYGYVCIRWASIGSHPTRHADNMYVLATYDDDNALRNNLRKPLYGFERVDLDGNGNILPHVQNIGYSRDVEYRSYAALSSFMNYTFDNNSSEWVHNGHPILWTPPDEYDDDFDEDLASFKFPANKILLSSGCSNTQHYMPPPFPQWAEAMNNTPVRQDWIYGELGIGDYYCLKVDETMISNNSADDPKWYRKIRVVIFPDCYDGVPYDDGTEDGRGSRWSLEMRCTGNECDENICGDDSDNDGTTDETPGTGTPPDTPSTIIQSPDEQEGACCFANTCVIALQSDCEDQGGVWVGAGTSCNPNPCIDGDTTDTDTIDTDTIDTDTIDTDTTDTDTTDTDTTDTDTDTDTDTPPTVGDNSDIPDGPQDNPDIDPGNDWGDFHQDYSDNSTPIDGTDSADSADSADADSDAVDFGSVDSGVGATHIVEDVVMGAGGCLVFGTTVLMSNGSSSLAEDLIPGNNVKTISFGNDSTSILDNPYTEHLNDWESSSSDNWSNLDGKISSISFLAESSYYEINGSLKLTFEHNILIRRDSGEKYVFVKAENISVGDYLVREDFSEEIISSVKYIDEDILSICIDTEPFNMFMAGDGYIIHNQSVSPSLVDGGGIPSYK